MNKRQSKKERKKAIKKAEYFIRNTFMKDDFPIKIYGMNSRG